MEHKIIKTENYLLVVSDEKIKEDDYALLNKKTHLEIQKALPSCLKNAFKNAECWNVENEVHEAGHKKIIAHLPLNGEPYLEGVDVLPEIENEVYKLSTEFCIKKEGRPKDLTIGFIEGFEKSKETYKYTEEDLRKAIMMAQSTKDYGDYKQYNANEIIQSINQPKLPIAFECEVKEYGQYDCGVFMKDDEELETITNSEGRTQWVGTYIY